jgi:hypothetical protein
MSAAAPTPTHLRVNPFELVRMRTSAYGLAVQRVAEATTIRGLCP